MNDKHSNGDAENTADAAGGDAETTMFSVTSREEEIKHADDILRTMRLTKGARFNAHRRLQRKASISLASLSFLSIYAIAAGLIVAFFGSELGLFRSQIITLASSLVASLILFLNAFEYSRQYDRRSEVMRMTAQKIQTIFTDMELDKYAGQLDSAAIRKHVESYDLCLREHGDAHEDVDFLKFRWDRPLSEPQKPENERDAKVIAKYREKMSEYRHHQFQRFLAQVNWYWSIYSNVVWFVFVPPLVTLAAVLYWPDPSIAPTNPTN